MSSRFETLTRITLLLLIAVGGHGCARPPKASQPNEAARNASLVEYRSSPVTDQLKLGEERAQVGTQDSAAYLLDGHIAMDPPSAMRARYGEGRGQYEPASSAPASPTPEEPPSNDPLTNMDNAPVPADRPATGTDGMQRYMTYPEYSQTRAPVRSYRSPLVAGNTGMSASLYRESRSAVNDIYHDYRAFQPMDLITVVITEIAEGNRIANTQSKKESTFKTAIRGLLGIDDWFFGKNPSIDPNAVIDTETESEFRGQGQMLRSDRLRGTISAVVKEVLPSGILVIEGKKVISVNSEEQVMIISGLVRTRDVSSANTIESNKIANVRIDFFGKGTLGDIQSPGWFVEMLDWLWPF